MSDKEQADHFAKDVDALVDRYRAEYDITFMALIAILQMKIHLLCQEASERTDEA